MLRLTAETFFLHLLDNMNMNSQTRLSECDRTWERLSEVEIIFKSHYLRNNTVLWKMSILPPKNIKTKKHQTKYIKLQILGMKYPTQISHTKKNLTSNNKNPTK